MKKLHKLVVKAYAGPFVATFFLVLFVLLMQFLWKYIDDLVGKGLEWYIIAELLYYASATFVPLALPLAVLLSSIMTMGGMGEHYELVALKSAGISLNKILRPLVAISLILVAAAFYFSNNVLPVANLKTLSLLYDVRHQRPAFHIMEGVYYKGIDHFVIRVEEKEANGQVLRQIKIYDHTDKRGNVNLTTASWGTMAVTPDRRDLILTLHDGVNYLETGTEINDPDRPFQRTYFNKQVRKFDLSIFDLTRTDEDLFRNNFRMLNLRQLMGQINRLTEELDNRRQTLFNAYRNRFQYLAELDSSAYRDALPNQQLLFQLKHHDQYEADPEAIVSRALQMIRQNKDQTQFSHNEFRTRTRAIARHQIEVHRKFTLSIACMVLFLIGAPMGAIIRKGGFGLPTVIAIMLFVAFHVISIMGEKFAREGVLEAYQGMWIAPLLLLPLGIVLTIKATTDSTLLDADSYLKPFERIRRSFFRPD